MLHLFFICHAYQKFVQWTNLNWKAEEPVIGPPDLFNNDSLYKMPLLFIHIRPFHKQTNHIFDLICPKWKICGLFRKQ